MTSTAVPTRTSPRRIRGGWGVRLAPYLFLAPFIILFVVFLILPILTALWMSFFSVQRGGLGFDNSNDLAFVGLDNYIRAFQDQGFLESFGRVLLFGVVQVPVMMILAITLALLFDSAVVRAKRFFQLSVFLPYAVPSVVAALVWGFLYQPRVSPIVEGLASIGISVDFLAPGTVLWSIANVTIWTVTGVNVIIIFAALQTVPREMYEAARMDGAGEFRTALQIKLPMVLPAVVLTTLFSIIGTLQLFVEPLVLAPLTTAINSTFTPNMAAYNQAFAQGNPNLAAAMAVIVALIGFVFSFGFLRLVNRKGNRAW